MNCYSDKLRVCFICNADKSFNFHDLFLSWSDYSDLFKLMRLSC